MNYTIMTLEDLAGEQILDFGKSGNQYVVGLFSKQEHTSRTKRFGSFEEGFKCFTTGSLMIAKGEYSFEDRCNKIFGEIEK